MRAMSGITLVTGSAGHLGEAHGDSGCTPVVLLHGFPETHL